MSAASDIVLVHIGPEFPDYLNLCISQLRYTCGANLVVHVLVNAAHTEKVQGADHVMRVEELSDDVLIQQFEHNSRLDASFRNGFWKYTSARFFYIHAYMARTGIRDMFHIEYDNLVYVDFTKKLDVFRTRPMWCVMDGVDRCIPSFVYFRDTEILSQLLAVFLKTASVGTNDMYAIGRFANANIDTVGTLPIIANYVESLPPKFTAHAAEFGMLFDAAAVGQYIGGVDPRNKSGDTTGFINEVSVFRCDRAKIEWRAGDVPYLNNFPLVNLHVHSKDLGRWTNAHRNIVTGERIQLLCDIWMGEHDDFRFNPVITAGPGEKKRVLTSWTDPFDNPDGGRLFCYGHRLPLFQERLHLIKRPFVLVTHNSDENVDGRYERIMNHPLLLKWYAQNVKVDHPKVEVIPIGVANSMWRHGDTRAIHKAQASVCSEMKTENIYFFFSVGTNRAARERCLSELTALGLKFGSAESYGDYVKHLARNKYAICADGNGIDSHRLWECIILRTIPIMLRSVFSEKIAAKYPCVLLDSWSSLNVDELVHTWRIPDFPAHLTMANMFA